MASETRVSVQQDSEKPIGKNILAKAIRDIAGDAKKLQASGINEDCIVILVAEKASVGRGTVREMLRAMARLEKNFCR